MERKKFFLPWRCPKMSNLATLFTETQGALNKETFVSQDGRFGCVTEAGLIRDELLDTLEAFKEHKALLDIPRNSLVLATTGLPHTLQAFYEFKSHVNRMANNMGVI